MISDKAAAAIISLTLLALLIGNSSSNKSPRPKTKHVVPQPLEWSVANVNSSDCFATGTPDEWLRELDEPDARAVKTVNEDGSVTITKFLDRSTTSRRELYPTRLACLDAISRYTYVIQHGQN